MIEDSLDAKVTKIAEAFLKVPTLNACKAFLRDIATYKEIEALYERLTVAESLIDGETYRTIAKNTGTSTATVTRVAHWLHHGHGGYELVLGKKKS